MRKLGWADTKVSGDYGWCLKLTKDFGAVIVARRTVLFG